MADETRSGADQSGEPHPGLPVAGHELAAVENPVWAGLMATFCRTRGPVGRIIDAEAEELTAEQVAERVGD